MWRNACRHVLLKNTESQAGFTPNSFNSSVRERKRHAAIAWLERIQLRTFSSAIASNRSPEHPVRIESWMASSFISNVMDTV